MKFKKLKGGTVLEKTMNCEYHADYIAIAYDNIVPYKKYFDRGVYNKQVSSILRSFAKEACRRVHRYKYLPNFEEGWKDKFWDDTYAILEEEGLESLIKEASELLYKQFPKTIYPRDWLGVPYRLRRIAGFYAVPSRMIFLGYHPDHLRATNGEQLTATKNLLSLLMGLNAPTIIVKTELQ
jgi:hypothetical protein